MRTTLLICLSYLVTGISAGGYAGALERLWVFYAYRIDQLRPEGDRTLGYKCTGGWNGANCNGGWKSCNELIGGGNPCNLKKFLQFLTGSPQLSDSFFIGGPDNRLPPPRDTAINLWNKAYITEDRTLGNFKAFTFIRNVAKTTEWPEGIELVQRAVNGAKADHYASDRDLFDGHATAGGLIEEARAGDHGPSQLAAARTHFAGSGITVNPVSVGPGQSPVADGRDPDNPATPRWHRSWEKPDWSLIPFDRLGGFFSSFNSITTREGRQARAHRDVLAAFREARVSFTRC